MTSTRTDAAAGIAPDEDAGLRVLIAEDEPDCAESMAVLLRMYGRDVEVALSGPTALAAAQAPHPDVLLLDIGLPGMSGYEVAERLKKTHWRKNPLIIAVTGYAMEDDHRHSAASGIDLHLAEPVDPERLRLVLNRFQRVIGGTFPPASLGTESTL